LGDWSARLALAILVLERSGSPTAVGVVGLLFVIPWVGVGQVLTAWAGRFQRRLVLVGSDTFRGLAFVVIGTLDLPTPALLVVVGLTALADPVFEATKSAYVTELVSKEDYSEAIQVSHAAGQASSLLGYAMGGVLVAAAGAEFTLFVNGVTFMLSALLISQVRQVGRRDAAAGNDPSLRAGFSFLRKDRLSAVAFFSTVIAVAAAMSVESQVVVYAQAVSGFDEELVGLLSAITPLATLVAVTQIKTAGDDASLLTRGLIIGAVASAGAAGLLWSGADGVLVFVAYALVGVVFTFVTTTNVVVGRRLPNANRAAIFSVLQAGVFLGLSLGALLGGIVSDMTSPETAAGGAMAIAAVGMLLAVPFAFERPRHATTVQRTRWERPV
jgi:predicted MFS family arabinose efflux permease